MTPDSFSYLLVFHSLNPPETSLSYVKSWRFANCFPTDELVIISLNGIPNDPILVGLVKVTSFTESW